MSTLCIIPARGGSKGIPGKNLRMVAGKPLVAWSIEQARQSGTVDRVLVSTDSSEIAAVAQQFGAEVPFLRPAELATDEAPTEPVLIHALRALDEAEQYRPRNLLLLQPTCPVRKLGSIDEAVRLFTERAADSLLSVREVHPFLWKGGASASAMYDYMNRPRRQDVSSEDRLFEETGSIYLTKADLLLRTGNRLGGQIALYPMSSDESWDVDTESDLAVVEVLLARLVGK